MEIMNYEAFRERVKNEIMNYLPEYAEDNEARIMTVNKVNQKLDALQILPKKHKNSVSPNLYLEEIYERYKKCGDMDSILKNAANAIREGFKNIENMGPGDFKINRNSVVFMLINRAKNEELLKGIPHRDVLDLAIVYRMVLSSKSSGIVSAIINDAQMEKMGLTEEELYNLALKNSRKMFPEKMKKLGDVLAGLFQFSNQKGGMLPLAKPDEEVDLPLYILSNSNGINGAAAILYDDVLEKCASEIGDNLYILPSSIHESATRFAA